VPKDNAADGPSKKRDAEGGERRQSSRQRTELRKEKPWKDQSGRRSVHIEVVELYGGSDEARKSYLSD